MDSFEQAFDNATRVADVALKANQDLLKQLRRLRRASQTGISQRSRGSRAGSPRHCMN